MSDMRYSTSTRTRLTCLSLVLATLFIPVAIPQAQTGLTDDRAAGVALLEKGDALAAVKLLKAATKQNKNDIASWYWLGRAFEQQGKTGDARKAYERAAKLGDSLLMNSVEAVGFVDWKAAALSQLKPHMDFAVAAAEAYVRLNPKLSKSKAQQWSERTEFLRDFSQFPGTANLSVYRSSEVTTRARVLSKPEPSYTEAARKNQITGTVVLRAIFAEDGRVRLIIPIRRLPDGLTTQAIRAARQIKFVPATKDGKPVSMWMQLEYNFNLF